MSTWRPFPGCAKYEVSESGEVRHATTLRVLSGSIDRDGYRRVNFRPHGKRGKHIGMAVHRMVALTFLGECPPDHCVDHIDRDRSNNCVQNLRYLPVKENSSQGGRTLVGRPKPPGFSEKISAANTGERHPMAKLKEHQAAEILHRRRQGESRKSLAAEFGVSRSIISHIHHGKAWKQIHAVKVDSK